VQIPVFALERPWHQFVAWTYADEFARNHLKDMLLRERLGAFVPSAGVGTAFSRKALEMVAATSEDLFPEGALTEDYQVGLRLHERGLQTIFVSRRLSPAGKKRPATAAAYVATREYFPDTMRTAIRQKSRWVAGICLQSWREMGWRGNVATRYTLYRDRKGVVANVCALFGWVFVAAALIMDVWGYFDRKVVVPIMPFTAFNVILFTFVLFATLFEMLQTASFVTWIYGPFEGVLSMIRTPVAVTINGFATFRAIYLFLKSVVSGRPMVWAKTSHVFPSEAALAEFRRQIGELLVERGSITSAQLEDALEEQRQDGGLIGEILVRRGSVGESDLVNALAFQSGATVIDDCRVEFDNSVGANASLDVLYRLEANPIGRAGDRVLVAASRPLNDAELNELRAEFKADITRALAAPSAIRAALEAEERERTEKAS
jgi:adsorption protein B